MKVSLYCIYFLDDGEEDIEGKNEADDE